MKINELGFKNWLIIENITSSQFLKLPENIEKVRKVKNQVADFVNQKMIGINQSILFKCVNWFVKELIVQNIDSNFVLPVLNNWWDNLGAWLTENINQIHSKLNLKDYSYSNAIADSDIWHNSKKEKGTPGSIGRQVVDLNNVPGFKGWQWVDIGKSSCDLEAYSMGHCGNKGGDPNDRILSLRDPENIPHLTFINKDGYLGEMKGRGNSKPAKKYHPAIIKLLLSKEIGVIKGGGYAPESNFKFEDLTPEQQKYVKSRKKYINNLSLFNKNKEEIKMKEAQKDREIKRIDIYRNIKKSNLSSISEIIKDFVNYENDLNEKEGFGNRNLWRIYNKLLDLTYKKSTKMKPSDLFSWMDKVIETYINQMFELDKYKDQMLSARTGKNHVSIFADIVKSVKLAHKLDEGQPEVLRMAPSRSEFDTYDQYIKALSRYLYREGYDLPSYNPSNNMISYEFNRKFLDYIKGNIEIKSYFSKASKKD